MKLVFFGSSDFSLPLLEACLTSRAELVQVITTPDQKKGRGLQLTPNPVRQYCQERQIACEAFETLKDSAAFEKVRALHPDIFVVASYGKIIPSAWLELPQGRFNVHPSLLPKYRGAAPLNWPILEGEKETGLCIAEITPKLDSGDIFFCRKVLLDPSQDAARLSAALSEIGRQALKELLDRFVDGEVLPRQAQDEKQATYARKLCKDDGRIAWHEPAEVISRKVRGLKPWPGAAVLYRGEPLGLLTVGEVRAGEGKPGTLIQLEKTGAVEVQTGQGILKVLEVKPAGRKTMKAADFVRGQRIETGDVLKEDV